MSNCYLTPAEFEASSYICAWQTPCCLSGTALSGLVSEMLDVAYSLINNYIGRSLCVEQHVDRFRGKDDYTAFLRYTPVLAITGFTYQYIQRTAFSGSYDTNFPTASGTVLGAGLVDDRTGLVESMQPFRSNTRFTVRYVAGYEIIPDDIKTAMKILTAHLSQQIDSGNLANPDFSVEIVKADTGGFTFGGSKMIKNIVVRTLADLSNLPITVFKILDKYKYSKGLGL